MAGNSDPLTDEVRYLRPESGRTLSEHPLSNEQTAEGPDNLEHTPEGRREGEKRERERGGRGDIASKKQGHCSLLKVPEERSSPQVWCGPTRGEVDGDTKGRLATIERELQGSK